MIKLMYKEEEFVSRELLFEKYPVVYMASTEKIKDDEGKIIGRRYFYQDYTQEQLDEINKNAIISKVAKGRTECFEIVNRGILWYDSLTITQKTELKTWYQEWLDITDKPLEYIPIKPDWIK